MNPTVISLVEWLIKLVRVYFIAGFIFAVLFSIFGVQRTDPGARGIAPFLSVNYYSWCQHFLAYVCPKADSEVNSIRLSKMPTVRQRNFQHLKEANVILISSQSPFIFFDYPGHHTPCRCYLS